MVLTMDRQILQAVKEAARNASIALSEEEINDTVSDFRYIITFLETMKDADTDPVFGQIIQNCKKDFTNSMLPGSSIITICALHKEENDEAEQNVLLRGTLVKNAGKHNGSFIVIPRVL